MLHPAPRLHDMPEPARSQHHQRPASKRLPVVMTKAKADWFWVILMWTCVTGFMVLALWLNIGTR